MENIQLYNGDCLEVMDRLIEQGVKVDAIITDPPYNISKNNNFHTLKTKNGIKKYNSIDFGDWDKNFNEKIQLEKALQLLKCGGNIIIFCNWKQLTTYYDILENNCCLVKNMIQWIKPNSAPKKRDRLYIVNYEVAIWATKGKGWTFNRQDEKKTMQSIFIPFCKW